MRASLERYGIGIVVGAVITVALLYLMQAVIQSDKNPLNEAPNIRPIDFVRLLDDIDPEQIDRNIKPPIPPDEVPPDLPQPDFDLGSGEGFSTNLSIESMNINTDLGISGLGQDGEYLPLVKVEPIYPRRALQRGIEGYVILRFTVTETGTVQDPVVVEAKPPGIFDRAAIQAALKFKYKPRVFNEQPIEVEGVLHRITFEIKDER